MRVLVVNAGSSSVKLRVLDGDDVVTGATDLDGPVGALPEGALVGAVRSLGDVDAVGHRVVHGGTGFTGPTIIDAGVVRDLGALVALAPLHQPPSLAAIAAITGLLPDVPAVACFDTSFHATLPAVAATYALPEPWRRRFPLRRFGFHGLAHEWNAGRAAELLGRPDLRVVSCHLGGGASLAAVRDGRSVDTTMGFTPLEGVVMATRSGSVDPGLVLWLATEGGLSVDEVAEGLYHRAGLAGLAGTPDMRAVVERASTGDRDAELALGVYVHRLCGQVAAMAAALGGLDALVFSGGVGEHAPVVRARACDGLGFLGVALDGTANDRAVPDVEVSADGAAVRTCVVTAREDLVMARQVRATLA